MTGVLHVGIEHPNALLLAGTAIVSFLAGGIAVCRASSSADAAETSALDAAEE